MRLRVKGVRQTNRRTKGVSTRRASEQGKIHTLDAHERCVYTRGRGGVCTPDGGEVHLQLTKGGERTLDDEG